MRAERRDGLARQPSRRGMRLAHAAAHDIHDRARAQPPDPRPQTGAEGSSARVVQRFSHVMRCTGPALELDLPRSPLLAALIHDGRARHDCARLGIATGPHGQLIEASGLPSERLFALGQLCRASRWETTSVPEIVCDAVALAELLSAA